MYGRCWISSLVRNVETESSGKVSDFGRVACAEKAISAGSERARRDSNSQPSGMEPAVVAPALLVG